MYPLSEILLPLYTIPCALVWGLRHDLTDMNEVTLSSRCVIFDSLTCGINAVVFDVAVARHVVIEVRHLRLAHL